MRTFLPALIIILAILTAGFLGCADVKRPLARETFAPSELKEAKTLSVKLFAIACIPKYDVEPVDNLRQYLAEELLSSLRELNVFSDIRILAESEETRTDLVFEGELTAIDEGERGSTINELDGQSGGLVGRLSYAISDTIVSRTTSMKELVNWHVDMDTNKRLSDEKTWALLVVKGRIIKTKDSSVVYGLREVREGRGEGLLFGYRCLTCPSADIIMRQLIDDAVGRITADLKTGLA